MRLADLSHSTSCTVNLAGLVFATAYDELVQDGKRDFWKVIDGFFEIIIHLNIHLRVQNYFDEWFINELLFRWTCLFRFEEESISSG